MIEAMTAEARIEKIRSAVSATGEEPGVVRSEQLRWKDGEALVLPVVKIPLEATVLNPSSHRIRAELEARGDSASVVKTDPYGTEAQQLIADILSSTPGFTDIKGALERDGQLKPGVVTHAGLLVNANTRRVALEELGKNYIDVVVLPEDAGEREITDLELELQMERDVRQEYTFTARLLFIEELLMERGLSPDYIGLKLERSLPDDRAGRKKAKELINQEMRLLRIIRDVVDASQGARRITSFDDDRQELIEIDQDYERERQRNQEQARRVRDAQLAALIADLGYKKMREVDATLIDDYLLESLEDQPTLSPYVNDLTMDTPATEGDGPLPAGLDLLDNPTTEDIPSGLNTTRLFTAVATIPENGSLRLRSDDGEETELSRDAVVASLKAAFTTAVDAKKRDDKAVDKLDAPRADLMQAVRLIDRARSGADDVGGASSFDHDAFADSIAALRRAVDDFMATHGG